MLDFDHPNAPDVIAAHRQECLIAEYCVLITLQGGTLERRFLLEIIRPAFAALRWLNRERFGDSPAIASTIDQFEEAAEKLAGLPLQYPDNSGGPAPRCRACGAAPTGPSKHDPVPHCSECLDIVRPAQRRLSSCEQGFGTEVI